VRFQAPMFDPPSLNIRASCSHLRNSTRLFLYIHPTNCAENRRFYLLGGKGGVGKTTSSAALSIHLASQGLPTLVVSTDPAHSLSDSLMQDISGGVPVPLVGTELPIWGMEIDPEEARDELRQLAKEDGGAEVFEMMHSVGLGSFADQLKACTPPALCTCVTLCAILAMPQRRRPHHCHDSALCRLPAR
jgi:hypothetical protein